MSDNTHTEDDDDREVAPVKRPYMSIQKDLPVILRQAVSKRIGMVAEGMDVIEVANGMDLAVKYGIMDGCAWEVWFDDTLEAKCLPGISWAAGRWFRLFAVSKDNVNVTFVCAPLSDDIFDLRDVASFPELRVSCKPFPKGRRENGLWKKHLKGITEAFLALLAALDDGDILAAIRSDVSGITYECTDGTVHKSRYAYEEDSDMQKVALMSFVRRDDLSSPQGI
jgi:hypothetical protein